MHDIDDKLCSTKLNIDTYFKASLKTTLGIVQHSNLQTNLQKCCFCSLNGNKQMVMKVLFVYFCGVINMLKNRYVISVKYSFFKQNAFSNMFLRNTIWKIKFDFLIKIIFFSDTLIHVAKLIKRLYQDRSFLQSSKSVGF